MPSALIGLRPGTIKAFYFDRAIHLWASSIEGEMDAAEARAKNPKLARGVRNRILENHLQAWDTPEEKAQRYRDPAAPRTDKPKEEPDEIVLGGDDYGRLRSGNSSR